MEHTRVKFYSESDISSGWFLSKAAAVLDSYSTEQTYADINDILEFYNIQKYFEAQCKLLTWTTEQEQQYSAKVDSFSALIGRFSANITDENFLCLLDSCDVGYSEDYWEICERYKVYQHISQEVIAQALQERKNYLWEILWRPALVKHYDSVLRTHMVSHPETATLLVRAYLEKRSSDNKVLYFPNSLTLDDKEKIINDYILLPDADLNTIALIGRSKSSKDLRLRDKTLLAARRKHKELVERHFATRGGTGLQYSISVCFTDQIEDSFEYEFNGSNFQLRYKSQWITDNLDYPTLLNNFIYLFEFVDLQFRSNFVCGPNHEGVFEKIMGLHGKCDYPDTFSYRMCNTADSLKMRSYYEVLQREGINLLNVFQWFFHTYLSEEFSVQNYRLNLPSEQTTHFEKCRFLLGEWDSILKQYNLYVENNEIDPDLLQISTGHMFVKDISSKIPEKYLYLKGDGIRAAQCLCSKDSILAHSMKSGQSYDSFTDAILTEELKKEDFSYAKSLVDWLIDSGFLQEDTDGFLRIYPDIATVLHDLYQHDVCCPHYLKKYHRAICWLKDNDYAESEQSLFSRQEQAWLNYILNQSEFHNGLDLRNKYAHGTQPVQEDDAAHYENYCIFLKCFVLAIIKINEEFCLFDRLQRESNMK